MSYRTEKKRRILVQDEVKTTSCTADEKPIVTWKGHAPWTAIKPLNLLMLFGSFLNWKEHALFAQACKTFLLASQHPTSRHSHRGELYWGQGHTFDRRTFRKLSATNIRPRSLRLNVPKRARRTVMSSHFGILSSFQPGVLALTLDTTMYKTGFNIPRNILKALSFVNLTELDISAIAFHASGLSSICPKLQNLTLRLERKCELSGLIGLPLVKLLLEDNSESRYFNGKYGVADVHDTIRRAFPLLETLSGTFTILAIGELGQISSLTDLTMSVNCEYCLLPSVQGMDLFKNWVHGSRLTRLHVDFVLYHYQQLTDICGLPLTDLSIFTECFYRDDSRRDMEWLRACTTLVTLKLRIGPGRDDKHPDGPTVDWSGLSALTNLTQLELESTFHSRCNLIADHYNLMNGSCLAHLAPLSRLQELKLDAFCFDFLAGFPSLRVSRLTIKNSFADSKMLLRIAEMKQLQELDVDYCQEANWPGTWIQPLLSSPTLHTLTCNSDYYSNSFPVLPLELEQACIGKFRKFQYNRHVIGT